MEGVRTLIMGCQTITLIVHSGRIQPVVLSSLHLLMPVPSIKKQSRAWNKATLGSSKLSTHSVDLLENGSGYGWVHLHWQLCYHLLLPDEHRAREQEMPTHEQTLFTQQGTETFPTCLTASRRNAICSRDATERTGLLPIGAGTFLPGKLSRSWI